MYAEKNMHEITGVLIYYIHTCNGNPSCTYIGSKDVFHHTGHIGLVLLTLAFKEVDDDSKTSRDNFRIIAVLILVQNQQTNNQNQCLVKEQINSQISVFALANIM